MFESGKQSIEFFPIPIHLIINRLPSDLRSAFSRAELASTPLRIEIKLVLSVNSPALPGLQPLMYTILLQDDISFQLMSRLLGLWLHIIDHFGHSFKCWVFLNYQLSFSSLLIFYSWFGSNVRIHQLPNFRPTQEMLNTVCKVPNLGIVIFELVVCGGLLLFFIKSQKR